MKFLAVFAALVAVAASQNTWTLSQLSDAIQSPYTDASLKPYLEAALNEVMNNLFAGKPADPVIITIPGTEVSAAVEEMGEWSLGAVVAALENPETDAALIPHLEEVLNQMMEALHTGQPLPSPATVGVAPAMEVTAWTLRELEAALIDRTTSVLLIPYLENALNKMMEALFSGQQMEVIVIAVPAGLIRPSAPTAEEASEDFEVSPESVVSPTPVATPAASSPLVQIIVNVNSQPAASSPAVEESELESVVPEPVIIPSPVMIPETVVNPEPVIIPSPVMIPETVIDPESVIIPSPVMIPETVIDPESAIIPSPVMIPTPEKA